MAAADTPRSPRDNQTGPPGENKHGHLTLYIIGAIVAAVVLSLVAPRLATSLHLGGEIFLRLLQMVVVPLVMASVMSGILGLGDVRKLGRPGSYAVTYYLTTTVLAVTTGLLVVNIVNPGVGINRQLVEDARKEGAEAVKDARQAMQEKPKSITWGPAAATNRQASGVSSGATVPAGRAMQLAATIQQLGSADTPASAVVQVSEDGSQYRDLGERLVAGTEADTYEWVVEIPRSATHVRIDYTAPQGGASSGIRAQIIRGPPGIGDILEHLVLMLFTDNLLASMVEINLLPLIVFSIVFAGMLTTMGERSETIARLVMSINDALMNFILLLMKLAPVGIFCLVAARFGRAQLEGQFVALLQVQFYYMVTVLSGLAVHALVTLPLLLWLLTRRNPYRFMGQMSQALLTAFSTASSTATLPVTMECAEVKAGVSKRSTEFVLPLGATVNMDGTALYEAAAAIFIAQAYAVIDPTFQLSGLQQLTIAVTATLAAIGAAGIPEAGLVTMLIVLNAVGLPLELIGLILPVDWLLDRFRTAVNAFGDAVGSAIVDRGFAD